MTVEERIVKKENEQKKMKEKKTVLVGIRIDKLGRELLNWALVKVAEPGDQVVALHVSRNFDVCAADNLLLEDYLEVYKGLCNEKKIVLRGEVCNGCSVRDVLVREAKVFDAGTVVLGVSRRRHALSSSLYVAKYCYKNLPSNTSVLAVHNGKVVYERGLTTRPPGMKWDRRPSIYPFQLLSLNEVETQSPKLSEISEDGSGESENTKSDNFRFSYEDREEVCSTSMSGSDSMKHDSVHLDQLFREEPLSPVTVKETPQSKPGWPLLRCAVSLNQKESEGARKMSVVQWVMSLPNRTPSLPETPTSLDSDKSDSQFVQEYENAINMKNLSAWGELPKEMELLVRTTSSNCKWFSHKELSNATSQFSTENLIGKGGCSRVYKGILSDRKLIAVKVLKVSKESWKDFVLEIDIISSLKHKNITPLIGVCINNNDLILVYDFFSKGSLEENLHEKRGKNGMPWDLRLKVAIRIAEAINYLHNECARPVIHRDIKSSNVLLSKIFEPQLSDFGLALWTPRTSAEAHFDVVGTFGYLAPEYFMYGKVTEKIDVYSFGVLLLELLSGRKPISDKTPKGQESLVMWAKPMLESGNIVGVMDPDLIGNFDEAQMQRMVLAVTLCITKAARLRPEMSQVVKLLKGEIDVEEWSNSHGNELKDLEYQEEEGDEAYPDSSAESHLSVALFGMDDGDTTTSPSSVEQNDRRSLDSYLKGRWSRSSSFN
ncbi:hypothetical protein MKX01_003775 [Papaver californicum]|nr:hypothetical protein MKX01_003775 [Papaver californicum]